MKRSVLFVMCLLSTSPVFAQSMKSVESTIQAKCAKDWPDDFRMRAYCVEQQREAATKLGLGDRPVPQDWRQAVGLTAEKVRARFGLVRADGFRWTLEESKDAVVWVYFGEGVGTLKPTDRVTEMKVYQHRALADAFAQ